MSNAADNERNYSPSEIGAMILALDSAPDLSDDIDPRTWREVYDAKLVTVFDVAYAFSFLPERYRVDVHGIGESVWSNNALTFATDHEAESYGADLYSRWMGMDDYRVVPDSTPHGEAYIKA